MPLYVQTLDTCHCYLSNSWGRITGNSEHYFDKFPLTRIEVASFSTIKLYVNMLAKSRRNKTDT